MHCGSGMYEWRRFSDRLRTDRTLADWMGKRSTHHVAPWFFELPQVAPATRANRTMGADHHSTTETDGWIDHIGNRFRGPPKFSAD